MTRGRLLVFLGAAPGVGKTFAMLEEAHRLQGLGRDVVVAVVETHGRDATARIAEGIEVVPTRAIEHRGVHLQEMDPAAVLERRPEVALVDELAHTNAPGSAHAKRWEDVEDLLDAGIDVLSTVNVQHIASLNDVVERITGIPQRETIPDSHLRAADRVELVDLAPQTLRDRLAAGQVYPATRIDAALSNYFRLGNLTALRELALLWLADEVDSALQRYRSEHGIATSWEARERVVVALTGGPEGETLLRRGARIAARASGGELLAVHVISEDGLRETHPGALATQRLLVEQLGGTFHQVVGGDIAGALIAFAKAANATQLVLGVSRRTRLAALLTGPGTSSRVVRDSNTIDVHMVNHSAAGRTSLVLPKSRAALSVQRRIAGFAVALIAGPLVTLLLANIRSGEALTAEALTYQLLVIAVALIGGVLPASFAAVLSGLTLDFVFVAPIYQVTISQPVHLLALLLYVVNGLLVSLVVDQAARRSRAARRATVESDLLVSIAGGVLRGDDALDVLVGQTAEAFGFDAVRLVVDGEVVALRGEWPPGSVPSSVLAVDEGQELEVLGPVLQAGDQRVMNAIAGQIGVVLQQRSLSDTASRLEPLAEVDRVRSALLAAVGHDLRRPLSVATAAVTSLRSPTAKLTAADRNSLLDGAEQALSSLAKLVTDLLDASRVQAGALAVSLTTIDVEDVLPAVLEDLQAPPGSVLIHTAEELPPVRTDAVLLQRILVNLLSNAQRFSPPDRPAELLLSAFAGTVQARVIDHGPGVAADRREAIFEPFQRLNDTDNGTGIGLGLALSRGFAEGMGGVLEVDETPGGGLTMVLTMPAASDPVLPEQERA